MDASMTRLNQFIRDARQAFANNQTPENLPLWADIMFGAAIVLLAVAL